MTTQKLLYITGNCKERPIVYAIRGENGDLLVDTGNEKMVHELDDWIKANQLNVKWVFVTHAHFDHTWNCRFLKQKYGAEIIVHKRDWELLAMGEVRELYASSYRNKAITEASNILNSSNTAPYCKIDHYITDEDTDYLRRLGFDADIIMLPGHTKGSMGILQGKVLYCGDACAAINGDYFTALFGDDPESIADSEARIFELDPLIIAPGHGKIVINEKYSGYSTFDK